MLSPNGWINSLSATFLVFFSLIFGLYILVKSIKMNAHLLKIAGLMFLISGMIYMGQLFDFLWILATGNNLPYTYYVHCFMAWIWIPTAFGIPIYIGAELLIPSKKKIIAALDIAILAVYEVFLLTDTNSLIYIIPPEAGTDLVLAFYNSDAPVYILSMAILVIFTVLDVFGVLYKAIRSKGILRKKLAFFSAASIFCLVNGILEAFSPRGPAQIFIRSLIVCGILLFYFSLREESVAPPEKPKKQVSVEAGLFRVYQRPAQITEEEISFHKEQKICLVCKAKVARLNYICPSCSALYCVNCAQYLSNEENTCWVCNTPIDETKPVKKQEKQEESQVTIHQEGKGEKKEPGKAIKTK
nr:B-box zinc finger protein [Candidatus Sigynarchaeota archaeon]